FSGVLRFEQPRQANTARTDVARTRGVGTPPTYLLSRMSICARPVLRCSAIGRSSSGAPGEACLPGMTDHCRPVHSPRTLGGPVHRSRKRPDFLVSDSPAHTQQGKAPNMRRQSWLLLAIAVPTVAAAVDGGVSSSASKPDAGVTAAPEKPV